MRPVLGVWLFALTAAAVAAQTGAGPIRPRRVPGAARPTRPAPAPPPLARSERLEPERRSAPTYQPPSDPIIAQAVEANYDFSQRLPNYLCRQHIVRSTTKDLGKQWKDLDVVEAEVLLVDQVEEYRDITIDGKPTGAKSMRDIGGAWSTGEYGAILWNIFAPDSEAKFTPEGDETLRGRPAAVYRYLIRRERSRWTLNINNRPYSPAHAGKVWIDRETGRALRIEMGALNLPSDYPVASAEAMVEYAFVSIGDEEYLLPVEAANIVCVAGSARCNRNRIEFRDYRKFTAESSIFNTESSIDFGENPETVEPSPEPEPEP